MNTIERPYGNYSVIAIIGKHKIRIYNERNTIRVSWKTNTFDSLIQKNGKQLVLNLASHLKLTSTWSNPIILREERNEAPFKYGFSFDIDGGHKTWVYRIAHGIEEFLSTKLEVSEM